MAGENQVVTGGVDTHKDVHVAAVIDEVGRILGTASFETTSKGYGQLLGWMRSHGELDKGGVEGTGAYGAGLARHLATEGIEVIEVNRPNRQMRRRRGKSDTVDAISAARAALNGEASVAPKDHDGLVESIRVLRVAFCSARQARTQAALQIRDLIVTAPEALRAVLGPLSTGERVARVARFRPGGPSDPTEATRTSLRILARRYEALSAEMAELEGALDALTAKANPAFRAARGVGPMWRRSCSPLLGTTQAGFAARPPSPPCAARRRSRHPRARPSATVSIEVAIARPITPYGASSWCG